MQRRLFLLVAFLSFVLTASAGLRGAYYKNYHIDAIVHPDNTWDITETMDVVFEEPRHGIYRYIPMDFTLSHPLKKGDKELVDFNYNIDISDLDVPDYEFDTDYDNGNKVIKIGSKEVLLTGPKRFVIKYKYTYPYDRIDYKDYICHTILGTDFEDSIQHFSFKIKFDKALPAIAKQTLETYSGAWGNATDSLGVKVQMSGNTLTGAFDSIPPKTGITIKFDLPEGYFDNIFYKTSTEMYVCFGLAFICLLVIIFYAFRSDKGGHITKQIEFYPPEGISSAEVGTIIDGSVDNIDIGSLIPWFASKGYLKIEEKEERVFIRNKKYLEVTKLKNIPDTAPRYQWTFMNTLFGSSNVVRLDNLPEKPEEIQSVKEQLESVFTRDKELLQTDYKHLCLFIPLLLLVCIGLGFASRIETFDVGGPVMGFFLFAGPIATNIFINLKMTKGEYMSSKLTNGLIFAAKCFVLLVLLVFASDTFNENDYFTDDILLFLIYFTCFFASEKAGKFLANTPYRVEMMGKLLGLKEFIETAEKQRLESLLLDDPEYFYKILPYALVLEVSTKWAKQFKDIAMDKPSWYETNSPMVNTYGFASMITQSISSGTINAITTVSHDSSSGGDSFLSGGGFSGGGGGGGGGGTW